MKALVVNFWGASGYTKSTRASFLYGNLSKLGYDCELVVEFAKELVWEGNEKARTNQIFVTATQYYRLERLTDQVDIIINDSPIPLGSIYRGKGCTKSFDPYMIELFNEFNNLNILLTTKPNFKELGRKETEDQSELNQFKVIELLQKNNIDFHEFEVDETVDEKILKLVKAKLL